MSEAAVADRPETETETGAETPNDTGALPEDGKGTDGGADVQAGEGEGKSSIAAAIEEGDGLDAYERGKRDALAALQQERETKRLNAKREQKNAKVNAFKEDLIATLGIDDEKGKQTVHKKGDALSLDIDAIAEEAVLEKYAEVMASLVPEARREAFVKEHDGKPMDEWVRGIAGELALDSTAFKETDAESLLKAHSKLRAAFKKHGEDEYERGRDNPRPTGERKGDERGESSGALTYARYMAMTAAERRDIPPAEEARLIREETARRGYRR